MLDPSFFVVTDAPPTPPTSPGNASPSASPSASPNYSVRVPFTKLSLSLSSPLILCVFFLTLLSLACDCKERLFLLPREHYRYVPVYNLYRMFTHPLAHLDASHWFHNLKNILLLGPTMEARHSTSSLLLIFLLSSFTSAIVHWVLSSPATALLGSSGLLFSLIGLHCSATLSAAPSSGPRTLPLTFLLAIAVYFGEEVFLGVSRGDNVSRLTHITGGLVGVFVGVGSKMAEARREEEKRRKAGKKKGGWFRWARAGRDNDKET